MSVETRPDPATGSGMFRRMGEQLGILPKSLRHRARQAEIDEGRRPGGTTWPAAAGAARARLSHTQAIQPDSAEQRRRTWVGSRGCQASRILRVRWAASAIKRVKTVKIASPASGG